MYCGVLLKATYAGNARKLGFQSLILGCRMQPSTVPRPCRLQQTKLFSQRTSSKKYSKEIGSMGYFMLLIPVTCFGLGCWQVRRREWKLGLIAHLEERTKQPATDFPFDIEELSGMEYRKVKLQGRFLHDREIYLGPRCKLDNSQRGLMGSSPPGFHVITPFQLTDRELTILVNRGWVPKSKLDPRLRSQGQTSGEVSLSGVVRLNEKRQPFGPKNRTCSSGSNPRLFFHRDLDAMAQLAGSEPVLIDADLESSVEGGPLGGQTNVTMRNEHLSYIFTWFTLSAATSAMWYAKYLR